ncbi:MAG: hypothetical protein P4N60_11000 [Verrucomicrobiae bacterium]|nr:hypothetical protein [Verrucomicrobiae bacterium]
MKKLMLILVTAVLLPSVRAALPQPDLLAQIHFAGGDRVAADPNYSAFATEFSSPEALALRQQTANKLTPWLAGWLQANLGTTVPDGAAKLRPLFDDLQAAEWFLEARAAAGGKPDVAIAIKLAPTRAQAWQTALKPYFPAATFTQSGGWLIFDSGTGAVKASDTLAQKLATPPAGWLSVDVNWPRLAQWSPELKELALPETKFDVTAADANLHINGKFFFPENLSIKLDPWQFPSNTVHQPLISLTAARGFANWLGGQNWAQSIKLTPPANQMFTWSMKGMPLQSFAAVPVPDGAAALRQLDAGLGPVVINRNAHGGFISPLELEATNNQITLVGAPFIAPYLRSINDSKRPFLLAGGFPNAATLKNKPLPPELAQSLATPNLVFYHWEITAERLEPQLNLSQLALMLTRHKQLGANSAAFAWVTKTASTLGNTVTEITQTAPDQFAFTRTAPGGLTAFEFLVLANWLDTVDFPHHNISLPPMKQIHMLHPKPMAAPAPAH